MECDVLVEWDDRYSVGIPLIDDQHKELIRLTNELYKGCLAGDEAAHDYFMSAVKGTVDYVKYHFSAEEKLLENAKYPEIADHKRQHEGFIKQILGDVQSYQGGKKFVPNVFVRYLKDWILSHIAVMDKKYAAYILGLKKQGALTSTIGV
ncbi:bacteriohemerythrin [Treponema primitia]|uniref:bacteriohemerythrin n=1 Tax=Treponema primitia TaxID=88058 RepID=UPI0002554E6D|nr:bacteriohemerythrin [Treponema primitia]